jgi:hypothetical protein
MVDNAEKTNKLKIEYEDDDDKNDPVIKSSLAIKAIVKELRG